MIRNRIFLKPLKTIASSGVRHQIKRTDPIISNLFFMLARPFEGYPTTKSSKVFLPEAKNLRKCWSQLVVLTGKLYECFGVVLGYFPDLLCPPLWLNKV